MSRWTWVSLGIVLAAGAATAWYWCRLLAYNMPGLSPRAVEPDLVASSALPSGLLALAALLRRRSAPMQRVVAAAAVGLLLVQVLTIRSELAADWSHGTGFVSFLALVASNGVAAVVLVAAVVAAVRDFARNRRGTD